MKVSQPELLGSAAIVLYIVLFSHSPPTALRSALSNVFIAAGVFAAIAYITLWKSRTLGVLLVLAFLLTMTRVTEHMDASATSSSTGGSTNTSSGAGSSGTGKPDVVPPTNTPGTPPPPTSGTTMDAKGNIVDSSGKVVQVAGTGAPPSTDTTVSADAKSSAAPAKTPEPDVSLNASVSLPTAPAIPPAPTFPSPVMSCNVESFTPF